nr:hypothetical protein [Tanacetum cinerariifolium]
MITDEMKLTKNYHMYANVFWVDVPTTQSQPIESTQGTHRTSSTPRSHNPDVDERESSAQRKSTVIRLFIPPRESTRLTPLTPIPAAAEVEEMIIQDIIQLSITEQKSRDDLDAKQNEEKVKEHLIAKEIEKMVEGTENVKNDKVVNSVLNNQNDPDTREKGKHVEESSNTPSPTPIRSHKIHSTLISLDTEKLQELMETDPKPSSYTPSSSSPKPTLSMSQHILSLFKPKTGQFKRYKSFFDELQGRYGYLLGHLKRRFLARKKFNVLAQHLQEVMEESLPNIVYDHVKELTKTQVPLYVAEGLIMQRKQNQADVTKMIVDAIQQERENLQAEITLQINNAITNHIPSQVDSSVRSYMSGHILQVYST